MTITDRDRDLDALFRFIERHTFRESTSLPWILDWVGEYPTHVLTRDDASGASFREDERRSFIQKLSAQREAFKLLLLTDGQQQQFEIVESARPEVRVFYVDCSEAVVTVYQGSPHEAAYFWARCRPKLAVRSSQLKPRPRGPITSFQPVYLPAGQFA